MALPSRIRAVTIAPVHTSEGFERINYNGKGCRFAATGFTLNNHVAPAAAKAKPNLQKLAILVEIEPYFVTVKTCAASQTAAASLPFM